MTLSKWEIESTKLSGTYKKLKELEDFQNLQALFK
jgi:hypothetical protein